MVYKVIWSARALEDLKEIVRYIKRDKPLIARRFGLRLIKKAESLSRFPERGRAISKFPDPSVMEILVLPYRRAYRIRNADGIIEIARIWHGARSREHLDL